MASAAPTPAAPVRLSTIVREWGRIGCIGFGGPPAHIALLRKLCVTDRGWIAPEELEDAIAAVNLLPGPASTQLAIYCAWRLRGRIGAVVGGVCFIVPGLVVILALAALFITGHPPAWLRGAAAGADAAVPAVALQAAAGLLPASWTRAGASRPGSAPVSEGTGVSRRALGAGRLRWAVWLGAGAAAAASSFTWLVLVLVASGLAESALRTTRPRRERPPPTLPALFADPSALMPAVGGLLAVAWVALEVGALSYGGGFVIVPLMEHDAVSTYHWMSGSQFLDAVALGQVTPGPVVLTVAAVGYAAHRLAGGLLAAVVAFAPSFVFVILGGPHLQRIRDNPAAQGFFAGAGPAAIGAIAGAAVALARSLPHLWQFGVLALAALWLVVLRRNVVAGIVGAALLGVLAALAGASIPS